MSKLVVANLTKRFKVKLGGVYHESNEIDEYGSFVITNNC